MKYVLAILFNVMFISVSFAQQDIDVNVEEARVFAAENTHVEIQFKKSNYAIDGQKNSAGVSLEHLSSEELTSFYSVRLDFLKSAAKALQTLKWGFGFGMIVKNHMHYVREKKNKAQLIDDAQRMDSSERDEILLAIQDQEKSLEPQKTSFASKSDQVITGILNSLDQQLWEQAAIVAHANEFGFVGAVGLVGIAAKSESGRGGQNDIGISIGYNRDDKSVAIQIFHDYEVYQSSRMPVIFIAGLVFKAGFYIANQGKDLNSHGTSFSPPVVPGFSISTKQKFMTGFSSGLTWPPSPIGDMLTYTNKVIQTTLLRLTFSPMTKGFVRFQSGALQQLSKIQLFSMKDLVQKFKGKPAALECTALF